MPESPVVRTAFVAPDLDEPLLAGARPDYADAVLVEMTGPDLHSAEEWMRCGLEEAPAAARPVFLAAWRYALRFRLGPHPSPEHVLGWRLLEARPDVIQIEAAPGLVRGQLIGRRIDERRVQVTTYLFYERPRVAGMIWTAVGPVHRFLALRLTRAAGAKLARRPAAAIV